MSQLQSPGGIPLLLFAFFGKGLQKKRKNETSMHLNRLFEEYSKICTFAAILWSAICENDLKGFFFSFRGLPPGGFFHRRVIKMRPENTFKKLITENIK